MSRNVTIDAHPAEYDVLPEVAEALFERGVIERDGDLVRIAEGHDWEEVLQIEAEVSATTGRDYWSVVLAERGLA